MRTTSAFCVLLLCGLALGQKAPKVGDVDPKGHLVIFTMDKTPFLLQGDYGVMLVNDGDEKHPKARYILASRAKKTLFSTTDAKAFQRALSKVPAGSAVRQYDSCTVSLSYGLPEKSVDDFRKAMKTAKLKLAPEPNITCVCDEKG